MTDPIEVIELAMRHHLGVPFEDYRVMCLCIGDDNVPRPSDTFEGPVFHRQHVAERIIDALSSAGFSLAYADSPAPLGPE